MPARWQDTIIVVTDAVAVHTARGFAMALLVGKVRGSGAVRAGRERGVGREGREGLAALLAG